jgi:aerobic carbon-monoxide dehydrogenase medium subunit
VKPAPFEYHAPTTTEAAVSLLAELGDEAKVLAGGQSLIPMLALRLAVFEHLVDVGRVASLQGIERQDGFVWIGAGTTEAAVGAHPEVRSSVPLLTRSTPFIGHLQIRNRGTLGGSIAHADPAAEYPAVALALDAELEVASTSGSRRIAAVDFFTGIWSTAMEPDELLTGVRFPVWSGRCGFAVEELARRHGDYAVAGAVVGVELGADDVVVRAAIGLISMGFTPLRASVAEAAVTGRAVGEIGAEDVGQAAVAELEGVPADLNGSATYRTRVGAVMVARAWAAAVEEARGG